MPCFALRLGFAPSFHRGGAIRVEGDVTGMATFDAHPTGLLPRLEFALPVDAGGMAAIHAHCSSMLAGWDGRWDGIGCDGMSVGGTFASPGAEPRQFSLWSPDRESVAHAMLRAVLDCFPPERCGGAAGEQLEIIRSHLGLQPPVTLHEDVPLRLRLAPWAHRSDANEIEARVRTLPEHGDLLVDLTGFDGIQQALAHILPMDLLLKRRPAVHWQVAGNAGDALSAYGIMASAISTVDRAPISETGYPVVLGGYIVSSPALMSLAQGRARLALVSALRQAYPMTVLEGAKAATELIHIMETFAPQSKEIQ